ncbi:MAG: type II toxin-antitoxin system VapC family toxin [Sandaracinaceae bacterium]|nr:type II toxin-antitoxin system VapC family toxin [Sandaracinaceae bacterium]
MIVLLDTNVLVALCDSRDRLHPRARHDLDRLSRRTHVAGSAVLGECVHLLERPDQRERLARLVAAYAIQPLAAEGDLELHARVHRWLARYAEHDPDWADGVLAVAATMLPRARVWTYDREFWTTWRREDGTRIPLANDIG